MEWALLAAAILCLVGCIGHIVVGEKRFLPPFLAAGIVVDKDAAYTAATLRLAWHVWSLAYGAFAAIYGVLAIVGLDDTGRFVVLALAALFAACALVSIPVVRRFHPAQVLFGAVAVLSVLALL
jgi:hypothetical protein